jgi:hypothetical protein
VDIKVSLFLLDRESAPAALWNRSLFFTFSESEKSLA